MIIHRRSGQILLMTQPAHAALAADLMEQWQLGGLPDHPRRTAILAATRDHDEGWREEDTQLHVSDSGAPLDFIAVPREVKHRIWPRATARLAATTSPYVAALVAEHALTVHAQHRSDPAWRGFFADMTRTRDRLLAQASPEEAAGAMDDYRFVRIGDQLSLIFCNGWTAPMSGAGYHAILKGITLEISPDPFGGRRIPMRVEARSLPARSYASAADVRNAYGMAPSVMLEGHASGA